MRAVLIALALIFIPLSLACSDSEGSSSGTTATSTPGISLPPPAAPPSATAGHNGATVAMGIGSYCWSAPGAPGICRDMASPVTGTQALAVTPSGKVDVVMSIVPSTVTEVAANSYAATGTPQALNNELTWNIAPTGGQALTASTSGGISFTAPATPGRYVVTLFLRAGGNDVSYGILLEVR